MCKYCDAGAYLVATKSEEDGILAYVKDKNIVIYGYYNQDEMTTIERVEIQFCPMCGERL